MKKAKLLFLAPLFLPLRIRLSRIKMKTISRTSLFLCFAISLFAGEMRSDEMDKPMAKVLSAVHEWEELPIQESKTSGIRPVLKGSTTHLEHFEIHAATLEPNLESSPPQVHDDLEKLIIIIDGSANVTVEGNHQKLGPGSIALVLPGDEHEIANTEDAPTSYYVLKYRSKKPMDLERGRQSGGSFTVDWNEVAYREHSKGGRRDFFNRPTAMCENFEMHVTNLNEKTASHEPHTHLAEEIILLLKGDLSMHIDGTEDPATQRDLTFLDSNVPHRGTNTGVGQSIYFAFQWR